MKLYLKVLIVAVIDFILIWLWVRQIDPDPSVSIGIFLVVPFVVVINLVLALALYFIKRPFAKLFLYNAIISAVLMYFLFDLGIERHQQIRYESWTFKIRDTTFRINHLKLDSTFSISESTRQGTSTVFLDGNLRKKGNDYLLINDSTNYVIKNGMLSGFRNDSTFKLTKLTD